MPVYADGQKVKEAQWNRLISSIPSSYTVYKDGSDCYAECNVKGGTDYGPDTDVSTVIQAAIDALTNGGIVLLKRGVYDVVTAITIAEGVHLVGEGWGEGSTSYFRTQGTVLKKAGNINVITATGTAENNVEGFSISNLAIVGEYQLGGNAYTGEGIYLEYCKRFQLYNLAMRDFYDSAIHTVNCGVHILRDSQILRSANSHVINYENVNDSRISNVDGGVATHVTDSVHDKDAVHITGTCNVYNSKFYSAQHGIFGATVATGNHLNDAYKSGISTVSRSIVGNFIKDPNRDQQTVADCSGIQVTGSNTVVEGNAIIDLDGYMRYGIWVKSGVTGCSIQGNVIYNPAVAGILPRANNIIRNNSGYITENSGTATITNGTSSIQFAHDLAGTPTLVTLGATHAEVADAIWSADATNITITVPSNVTADRKISWDAEYKP